MNILQERPQDFNQGGGGVRFFRNKTYSGIRKKSKENGSKLMNKGTKLKKKGQHSRKKEQNSIKKGKNSRKMNKTHEKNKKKGTKRVGDRIGIFLQR